MIFGHNISKTPLNLFDETLSLYNYIHGDISRAKSQADTGLIV